MKKVLLATLVLAFCVPASAELVIYKIRCRERVFDPNEICPDIERIDETIWLILDVNTAELKDLGCGDTEGVGGRVIKEAVIFKIWRIDGRKIYDFYSWDDMVVYVLDGEVLIWTQFCDATCIMEGNIDPEYFLKSLKGQILINGQYTGQGDCRARLNTKLMETALEKGWTSTAEVLDHLERMQPKRVKQGDMCDPFFIP
jgi:hypothetical protein